MNEQAQAVLATLFPRTGRRYAMCLKKMGYPTLDDAETVRRRRQPLTEEILRIYGPCDYCTLWHLTHKPMTDAQVRAADVQLREEIACFRRAYQHLRQLARPYLKYHSMYRRSVEALEKDFAEQWRNLQQVHRLGLAKLQRERALLLAFAADAQEAQRVDRETDQRLREFEAMVEADIDGLRRLSQRYREMAVNVLNQEYPLPPYDWRNHLVSRG